MDLVAWAAHHAERRLTPLSNRWAHTEGVVTRARALAATVPTADQEVLVAAAYLHDVGYAGDVEDTGFHPLDGARWLRAHDQERLARLVAYHSGAAFEATARGLDAALAEFAEERSAVADVLTYCDLTTDSEGREITPSARLAEIESRYGRDSDVARGMYAAAASLAALVARAEARISRLGVAV
jgi:HD superfamily phosphodiesterase